MDTVYILIALGVLVVIFFIIFFSKNARREISTLGALAFAFVITGIVFGENRLIGYTLIGMGILLALIDIGLSWKKMRE